jgi:hypothetical protein
LPDSTCSTCHGTGHVPRSTHCACCRVRETVDTDCCCRGIGRVDMLMPCSVCGAEYSFVIEVERDVWIATSPVASGRGSSPAEALIAMANRAPHGSPEVLPSIQEESAPLIAPRDYAQIA